MAGAASPASASQSHPSANERYKPFIFRGGRKYLRDSPDYPLPVDLVELNRQNLRMTLLIQVFGAPFCSKLSSPPKRVLEIGCGTGLWVSYCHEYLKSLGHNDVSFVGLDIAPLAPDLRKQGINWQYVQHDLRNPPMPFKANEFDLIFVNDGMVSFTATSEALDNPLGRLRKYLKPGGVAEIWESDFIFRCLLPQYRNAPEATGPDIEQAKKTATYTISQAAPFTGAKNPYLQNCNSWLEAGFQKLGLITAPCASLGYGFTAEADNRNNGGSRRIAIPFSVMDWEKDFEATPANPPRRRRSDHSKRSSAQNAPNKLCSAEKINHRPITRDQAAIRQTALCVTVGLIESLEPLLQEQSGKKGDEWYGWWSHMKKNLLEEEGTAGGECLEAGAWWIKK